MIHELLSDTPRSPGATVHVAFVPPSTVAVVTRHAVRAAVLGFGLVAAGGEHAELLWEQPLEGPMVHTWAGHEIDVNLPSVVAHGGRMLAVGGTDRLAIDPPTGAVLARSTGRAAPTANAAVVDGALVVAEGTAVTWYDPTSLAAVHTADVPGGRWAWAPPAGHVLAVSDEDGEAVAIWDCESGAVHPVPTPGPALTSVAIDGRAVASCGPGAAEHAFAVEIGSGLPAWSLAFPNPDPERTPQQGPFRVQGAAALVDDRIVVITAVPAVVAVSSGGTVLWQFPLRTQPTVLTVADGVAWVGTAGRELVALDAATGRVLGEGSLPELADHPTAGVAAAEPRSVFVTGHLGSLHRFRL